MGERLLGRESHDRATIVAAVRVYWLDIEGRGGYSMAAYLSVDTGTCWRGRRLAASVYWFLSVSVLLHVSSQWDVSAGDGRVA